MSFYSIEVNYPLDGLTVGKKEETMTRIEKEIKQIANETNGEFSAFDTDVTFGGSGPELLGVNYNWEFTNYTNLIDFMERLPSEYKVLWIIKCVDTDQRYTIYSVKITPEIKKFTPEDTDVYRSIIKRLKHN